MAFPFHVIDQPDRISSAYDAVAVTPSDTNELFTNSFARAVFVGGAGNLSVTMVSGNNVTFTGVVAGTVLPIVVTQIRSTGTTATNIVALR